MFLQFVKNDNNGISQTKVTCRESTHYKKATELDFKMAENHEVQFRIEKQTEQAWAKQSEKLSDLKEPQSVQSYKNYYIGLKC